VVDYIASSRQPGLSRLEPTAPTPSIALRFDEWMLPEEVFNALTGEDGLGALEITTPPNAAACAHRSGLAGTALIPAD